MGYKKYIPGLSESKNSRLKTEGEIKGEQVVGALGLGTMVGVFTGGMLGYAIFANIVSPPDESIVKNTCKAAFSEAVMADQKHHFLKEFCHEMLRKKGYGSKSTPRLILTLEP